MDLFSLVLYCVQQFGVTLGVGAETIILTGYLFAIHDSNIGTREERFSYIVKKVFSVSIVCILISGVLITALELVSGNETTVFMPGFLFKWFLIGIVSIFYFFTAGNSFLSTTFQGLSGGTWYALFLVHILAPVASWSELGVLYVVWLVVFCIGWMTIVFSVQSNISVTTEPVFPNHQGNSIETQKPSIINVPTIATRITTSQPVTQKPTVKTPSVTEMPGLSNIRVMPRTQEDLQRQTNHSLIRPNQRSTIYS